jgi:hypothetical protein
MQPETPTTCAPSTMDGQLGSRLGFVLQRSDRNLSFSWRHGAIIEHVGGEDTKNLLVVYKNITEQVYQRRAHKEFELARAFVQL